MRILVVGSACSGTGCLAGVIHRLGVLFGEDFYGPGPHGHERCGYETPEVRDALKSGCDESVLHRHFEKWSAMKMGVLAFRPEVIQRLGCQVVRTRRPWKDIERSVESQWPEQEWESAKDICYRVAMACRSLDVDHEVDFYDLCDEPRRVIADLATSLRIPYTIEQFESAVAWVRQPRNRTKE